MMRLDKFLANAGVGSRSRVKEMCKKGSVSVNGIVVKSSDENIDEMTDCVKVCGERITLFSNRYFMLHKPAGVVSATQDNFDRTVLDCIAPEDRKKLFPVGRLDKDTTGLLLLTDDGVLSHTLLSPKKNVNKVYRVTCARPVDEEQIRKLEQGVDIGEEKMTLPAKVEVTQETTCILLTIQEGKFHQVKRMLHAVGNEVVQLKRLQMGSLILDSTLNPGEYRELTQDELANLMMDGK